MKLTLNILLYYIGWIAAVVGASRGSAYLGPAFNLLALISHLILMRKTARLELLFAVAVGIIGSSIDSLLPALGWISFSAPTPALFDVYPIWMTSLWVGFATTLSISLKWMQGRYYIGAIFGAVGGPASLLAGVALGAAYFHTNSVHIYVVSAVEWAILITLILWLHSRIIPSSPQEPPPRA